MVPISLQPKIGFCEGDAASDRTIEDRAATVRTFVVAQCLKITY
jgi:hypothetical protein